MSKHDLNHGALCWRNISKCFFCMLLCLIASLAMIGCPDAGGDGQGNDDGSDNGDTGGSGNDAGSSEGAWQTFTSREFKFKVEVRGKPKLEANRLVLGSMPDDPIYMVSFSKKDLEGPDIALNLKLLAGTYPADYEEESSEFFEWNGHPAYRVSAKGKGAQSDIRSRRMTVYANGIFYNVGITATKTLMGRDAEHFYNSFDLLE